MKKLFRPPFIFFIVLGFVVFVEGVLFYKHYRDIRQSREPTFTVLVKSKEDKTGRTVAYAYQNGENTGWSNTGYAKGYHDYIIGSFQKFEQVGESDDEYMYLTDPLGNENLPVIRLVYSSEYPFSPKGGTTRFGVENLDNPGEIDESSTTTVDKLGKETLEKLIQEGDIVLVFPWKKGESAVSDGNKALVAWWLVIRRFKGAKGVEY